MAEEIHQQAGQPGAGAPCVVLYAGVVADTGPAGIRRAEGKQGHGQIDAKHYQADDSPFTGALCHQAAKAFLFFRQLG